MHNFLANVCPVFASSRCSFENPLCVDVCPLEWAEEALAPRYISQPTCVMMLLTHIEKGRKTLTLIICVGCGPESIGDKVYGEWNHRRRTQHTVV